VHVPSKPRMSHARHDAVHAVLQQVPSGAHVVPPMQPPGVAVHIWPRLLLHIPVVSQVPAQLSSDWLSTAVQTPVAAAHAWHTPQLAVPQQTPSTQ
jgi:hypothetical protein